MKWAGIFTTDKWVFLIHIHKESIITNRFEIITNDFNKELEPFTMYEKSIYLFSLLRKNDIKFFRWVVYSILGQAYVYTIDT